MKIMKDILQDPNIAVSIDKSNLKSFVINVNDTLSAIASLDSVKGL